MIGLALVLIGVNMCLIMLIAIRLGKRIDKLEAANIQIDKSNNTEDTTVVMTQVDSKNCKMIIN